MKRGLMLGCIAVALAGCAVSGTQVLEPYQLADGSKFQDVVTTGADKSGTAPVVTHVKTFRIGGPADAALVTEATGTGAGLATVVTGAAVAGITSGVTAGVIVAASRRHDHHSSSGDDGGSNELDCSIPANAQTQECICRADPRLPGCEKPGDVLP